MAYNIFTSIYSSPDTKKNFSLFFHTNKIVVAIIVCTRYRMKLLELLEDSANLTLLDKSL